MQDSDNWNSVIFDSLKECSKKETMDLALNEVVVEVHVSTLTFIGIYYELLFECEVTT